MFKKVVMLILITVLIAATILGGCGIGGNSKETTGTEGSTAASTTAQTTEAEKTASLIPWTGAPIEISYMGPDYRTAEKTFDGIIDQELAKKFGDITIKYNYVPEAEWEAKMNLAMNARDLSDMNVVFAPVGKAVQKYGETGACLDFSKYLEYMPNYVSDAALYPLVYGKKGDQILFVDPCIGFIDYYSWNLNINTYYRDKFGIKDPTTADEMLEALRAVKKANPECVSPFSVFPATPKARIFEYLNQMFLGIGGDDVSEGNAIVCFDWQNTKKWFYPLYQPAMRDMVEYARTLYTEGLIAPDYDTQSWDKFIKNLYSSGDGWYIWADWNMFGDAQIADAKKIKPEFSVDFILPPTTSYQPKPVIIPIKAKGQNGFFSVAASANTKNPELVCSLIDYLHGQEVAELVGWGIEGKTYKRVAPGTGLFGADYEFLPELKVGYNWEKGTLDPVKDFGLYLDSQRHQFAIMAGNYHEISYLGQNAASMTSPKFVDMFMKYFDYVAANPDTVRIPEPLPELTADESDKVNAIYVAADTVIAKYIHAFITGKKPMSDWDSFIEELKKAGDPQQIADIYNSKPRVKVFAK